MQNTWKDITVDSYGWVAMLRVNQDGEPQQMTSYTASFVFTSPANVTKTRSASYLTDGTDGIFKYVTVSGDIDEAGQWSVVATVTASGLSIVTVPFKFYVGPKR